MVKKIDNSKTIKLKQKQNVNVKVNIDQRNIKRKPKKKRSNIPSAKREGVSSFSTGFTPVYIQSGNPYPIPPVPPVPDAVPIKVPVYQRDVPSFVNPPTTSTTNINQTQSNSRSISPTTLFSETPLLSESGMHGKGIMPYSPSLNREVKERAKEMQENNRMGNEDKQIPSKIQNLSIYPLKNEIKERFGELTEMRSMGNEDIDVNVKKVLRVRRTKREVEENKQRKEFEKIEKQNSKNERDLMKQEDTRRKEQLKKERNERNRIGRNDINII